MQIQANTRSIILMHSVKGPIPTSCSRQNLEVSSLDGAPSLRTYLDIDVECLLEALHRVHRGHGFAAIDGTVCALRRGIEPLWQR
jgi:hypothetical protein